MGAPTSFDSVKLDTEIILFVLHPLVTSGLLNNQAAKLGGAFMAGRNERPRFHMTIWVYCSRDTLKKQKEDYELKPSGWLF